MDQSELDQHFSTIKSFSNDLEFLSMQIEKVKANIWDIADSISSTSRPIYNESAKIFSSSKNTNDLKAAALVGASGLVIDGAGQMFGFIGSTIANIKGNIKLRKLREKKKKVAEAKIEFAFKILTFGNQNVSKFKKILKNDLSIIISDYETDSKLYYDSRQKSLDNYLKILLIIEMSKFLIRNYEKWIDKKDSYYIEPPNQTEILKKLFVGEYKIFDSDYSKDNFISKFKMTKLDGEFVLFIENPLFFNKIPLDIKNLKRILKKMPEKHISKEIISNNVSFKTGLENYRNKSKKKIFGYLLILFAFLILYYWSFWGWWNLLMVPIALLLFILALILIF